MGVATLQFWAEFWAHNPKSHSMDLGCLGYGLFGLRNLDTGESRRFELGHWGASTVRPNPKSHSMDLGCLGYGSFGFGGGANLGVRESMEVLGGVKYGGA